MSAAASAAASDIDVESNESELAEDLLAALIARPIIVTRASQANGRIEAEFDDVRESLCELTLSDSGRITDLSSQVSFLRQRHWKKSHTEVFLQALRDGRARAIAVISPVGDVPVSLLDFRDSKGSEVEIGFCMTHPTWRRRGYMTRLLATVVFISFGRHMVVTTAESNAAMQRRLRKLGFALADRVAGDRVNGEATLVFRRTPFTPFDLHRPAPDLA